MASTGSASAYIVTGENLILQPNKPLPEPVEGCGVQEELNQVEVLPELVEGSTYVSLDPAMASTASASAYVNEEQNKQTYKPSKKEKTWKQK